MDFSRKVESISGIGQSTKTLEINKLCPQNSKNVNKFLGYLTN